jgi:hypothetical protein
MKMTTFVGRVFVLIAAAWWRRACLGGPRCFTSNDIARIYFSFIPYPSVSASEKQSTLTLVAGPQNQYQETNLPLESPLFITRLPARIPHHPAAKAAPYHVHVLA